MASYDRAILEGSGITLPRGVYIPKSEYIDRMKEAADKRNTIHLDKDRDRIMTIGGIETTCDITYFPWRFINLEGHTFYRNSPQKIVKELQQDLEDYSDLPIEIKKALITEPENLQAAVEVQLRNRGTRGLYRHWADKEPVGSRYHDAIRKFWYASLPRSFVKIVEKYCEGKTDQEVMEFQSLSRNFRERDRINPTNRGIIIIPDLTQEEVFREIEGFLHMDSGSLPDGWQKGKIDPELAKNMLDKAAPMVKIKMRNAAAYSRHLREWKKRYG